MILAIEQDATRFRQIIRGKIKQNLRSYIANGELIGRQGKDLVSIPVPQITLPNFRFGDKQGGTGQGEGEIGDSIGSGNGQSGSNGAGNQPGRHILEVELTLEELAQLLGEELELPRIEPKSKHHVEGDIARYTGIRRVGPDGLRHFKRTYREALKRQLASGTYNAAHPAVIPIRDDKRYRSWKIYPRPDNNAAIIYMMDVSGSMTDQKKQLVRLTAFWIDTWLRAHYKRLKVRYIVHDAAAHEVDAHTFYHIHESGGTRISSAYEFCHQMIQKEYPPDQWNVYAFHFSDGENYDNADDQHCQNLLEQRLLSEVNLFGYGQVGNGSDEFFWKTLASVENYKIARAAIHSDEDVYDAIKVFLGKGA